MAILNSLALSSPQEKVGVIEVGIGETITAIAHVTGTDTHEETITCDLCRANVPETTHAVTSWTNRTITVTGAGWVVNGLIGRYINIDISRVNRILMRVKSNTADTLTFGISDNLATHGYTGTETIRVTNIWRTRRAAISDNHAEIVFDQNMTEGRLGTSVVFGEYYLRAYWTNNENNAIVTPVIMEINVVLVSVTQIKNEYLAQIPLRVENPDYPESSSVQWVNIFQNDDPIYSAISKAISEFETVTGIHLRPKKVVTNPDATEICDIAIPPIDYEMGNLYAFIKLPHHHILSIDRVDGYIGGNRVITWNVNWYAQTWDRHCGSIQMVPMLGSIAYQNVSTEVDWIGLYGWPEFMPGFWHVDYTIGWPESIRPIPDLILKYIGQYATIQLLPIIADAITQGVSSNSISMDGISVSKSRPTSGENHIFSAKSMQYKKSNDEIILELRQSEIPMTIEVV